MKKIAKVAVGKSTGAKRTESPGPLRRPAFSAELSGERSRSSRRTSACAARKTYGRRNEASSVAPFALRWSPSLPNHDLPALYAFQSATRSCGQRFGAFLMAAFVAAVERRVSTALAQRHPDDAVRTVRERRPHDAVDPARRSPAIPRCSRRSRSAPARASGRTPARPASAVGGAALEAAARLHEPPADLDVELDGEAPLELLLRRRHVRDRRGDGVADEGRRDRRLLTRRRRDSGARHDQACKSEGCERDPHDSKVAPP